MGGGVASGVHFLTILRSMDLVPAWIGGGWSPHYTIIALVQARAGMISQGPRALGARERGRRWY